MTNLSGANLNNGVAVGPQGEGMDSPSNFPKYPAYKYSGVEWLGEVPEHWEVGSLRRLIKSVGNGTTADQVDEAEDTVAVSRIETISAGLINFEKVGHVGPQDVARRFLLNAGDILFSHINSLSMVGNVAIYSGGRPLLHGMNLLRIQPLPSISSEWLLYWLKSKNVRQEVESRAKPAINQASISTDSVRALPALIPPSFEQTQIARFLDHETARIDALIEEQQRLIELLKEKRQAVISHAVTKGLDPTAPMKDSGVEWLGKVPKHWAIFSLKRAVDGCTNGLWGDEPDGANDIAVIRVADFDRSTSRVGLDKLTYRSITQKERASRLLEPGDLLIEKSGGGEKTLVGCVVLFEHKFQAITSNFVARMRPLKEFDSGFLCYAFDSLYQGKVNYPAIKQTTGIQNLDSEAYLQERFCFPSRAEQNQISRFLDCETARIDGLIEEAQKGVTLLQERRSALISAAVTGKIDVRGWQPPASTQAPKLEVAEAN